MKKIRNLSGGENRLQGLLLEKPPRFVFLKIEIIRGNRGKIARGAIGKRFEFADQVRLIAVPIIIRQISQSARRPHNQCGANRFKAYDACVGFGRNASILLEESVKLTGR